ncbi:winged helix-turn-helix domain-containing protein [Ideonella sp. YS5]|uniref:winged helix-turn-helix domain-containing protein n=1 Tax=Ideonella sp. YS5 TaxID=3453714 RepID=UPI003EEFCBC2
MRQNLLVRAGPYEIDLGACELRFAGRQCAVEPRVISLLAYLAQRPDRVVTRQELLEGVWPGQPVSDAALARAVMKARQALGDASGSSPIRTVQRVGYRFVGERADPPPALTSSSGRRVAILPFDNATGDATLDWVCLGLMSLVDGAIGREQGISTVAVSALLTALDGARIAGADPVPSVRAATGAEWIVRGQVTRPSAEYRLSLECLGLGTVQAEAATPAELGPRGARALVSLLQPGTERSPAVSEEANPLVTTAFARALQAQAQQRHEQAANLLRMAEMLSPGSTPVRLELLRALCGMADLAAARPIARGLLAQAQRRHDGLLTARVHAALARAHLFAQAFEPAIDHIEQSLYWLGENGPLEEVARAQLMRAQAAFFTGDHAACEQALDKMGVSCEQSGDRLLLISRGLMLSFIVCERGDRDQAVELMLKATESARELHSIRELVTGGCNLSAHLVLLGRWSEAAAHAEQAFAAAVQAGDRISICQAVCSGSWAYTVLGVPAAAQRLVEALPADQDLSPLERLWAASSRGYEAASAGRNAQAVEFFTQALRLMRASGNRMNEVDVLPGVLRSLVHGGRLADAEAELTAARPLVGAAAHSQLNHCHALLAHARGQPEEALKALRQVVSDPQLAPLWRAWAVWDASWLLAEADRGGEAQAMLRRLPPRFDKLPLASAVAARVQLAQGDLEAAQRCHQQYLLAASHGLVPRYLKDLGECFAGARPAPPVPCLPSRL